MAEGVQGVAAGSTPPSQEDDDDDEDDEAANRRRGETMYAGGERRWVSRYFAHVCSALTPSIFGAHDARSGLAIQNPDRPGAGGPGAGSRGIVDNILRQASTYVGNLVVYSVV